MGQTQSFLEWIGDNSRLLAEHNAEMIAQRLLFQISATTGLTEACIQLSAEWLKAACLYLLENCPESDWIFLSLLKMARLERMEMECMLEEAYNDTKMQALLHTPQGITGLLEQAVWQLLDIGAQNIVSYLQMPQDAV